MSAVNFLGADRLVFPAGSRAPLVAAWALLLALAPGSAPAAELTKETKTAWRTQVAATEARIDRELQSQGRFLSLDFDGAKDAAQTRTALRAGTVTVRNLAGADQSGEGLVVPGGAIHHWRGAVFIPNVGVEEVLAAVADPSAGTAHRQEDVLEARVLSRSPNRLRLFLKLQRSAIVTATYNTEHDVVYRTHGPGRASSRSVATRIAEVVNLGEADEYRASAGGGSRVPVGTELVLAVSGRARRRDRRAGIADAQSWRAVGRGRRGAAARRSGRQGIADADARLASRPLCARPDRPKGLRLGGGSAFPCCVACSAPRPGTRLVACCRVPVRPRTDSAAARRGRRRWPPVSLRQAAAASPGVPS